MRWFKHFKNSNFQNEHNKHFNIGPFKAWKTHSMNGVKEEKSEICDRVNAPYILAYKYLRWPQKKEGLFPVSGVKIPVVKIKNIYKQFTRERESLSWKFNGKKSHLCCFRCCGLFSRGVTNLFFPSHHIQYTPGYVQMYMNTKYCTY